MAWFALPLLVLQFRRALDWLAQAVPLQVFTNEAIIYLMLEAISDAPRVHFVDLSMHSSFWRFFMFRLAARPGGSPSVRVTGVAPPPGSASSAGPGMPPRAFELEVKSAAEHFGVRCVVRTVTSNLEDLSPGLLQVHEEAPLCISSVMRLRETYDHTVLRTNPQEKMLQVSLPKLQVAL